jgi:NAD(P)-dependent dehydrogenase (short-subunit alcohol dehydrogenase family)
MSGHGTPQAMMSRPCGPLSGVAEVPGDKSISHRALILGASGGIGAAIADLKARGYTILMVEQNVRFASTVADRHYVIDRGHVAETFDNATLLADFDRISARLSA